MFLVLLAIPAVGVAACAAGDHGASTSSPTPGPSHAAPNRLGAGGTLAALFAAWKEMDAAAASAYLSQQQRTTADFGFDRIERVRFGTITARPDQVDAYVSTGLGSTSGVAPADVRCFQADVTYWYVPGYAGPTRSGEALQWIWFLESDSAGVWHVTSWGY